MPYDYPTPAAGATEWKGALNDRFGRVETDVRALAERVAALEREQERDGDPGGPVHYGGGWPDRLDGAHGWERPDRTTHAEVGGGQGYGRRFTGPPEGAVVAADRAAFLDALDSVPGGGTIWVPGDATIDCSGLQDLDVPRGVTLASDRGVDGSDGGLLHAPEMPQNGEPDDYRVTFLFRITGDDVRVTGLRIRGPRHRSEGPVMRVEDPPLREDGEPTDEMYDDETTIPTKKDGIVFDGGARGEIDNCELSGFPQMGVKIKDAVGYVHHCYVHHTNRMGYGYGVTQERAETLVEFCRFDHYRHAIASDGACSSAYEARYNVMGPNQQNHPLDVHSSGSCGSQEDVAGKWVEWHHNTILEGRTYDDPEYDYLEDYYATTFSVRGTPLEQSRVYDNWLAFSYPEDHPYGPPFDAPNTVFADNHHGPDDPGCGVGAPREDCPDVTD